MKTRQILKRDKRPRPVLGVVSRTLLLMTSKADKLPLETEPVARDNSTILTLKFNDYFSISWPSVAVLEKATKRDYTSIFEKLFLAAK